MADLELSKRSIPASWPPWGALLWDAGQWWEDGDATEGLRKGELKFRLDGRKLKGGWTLVRMKGQKWQKGKPNWLLIKRTDESADPSGKRDILTERPESVSTGRSLEEIRASVDASSSP